MISQGQAQAIAPNVMGRLWMLRPVMTGKINMRELRSLTLSEIADYHEIIDLESEVERVAMEKAKRDR